VDQCDGNVFKNGHSIATLDACMHRAETFVIAVREKSGQQVDWHYSCGRANVLYLGTWVKVSEAFAACEHILTDTMPQQKGECGSCGDRSVHREGTVLQRFLADTHGPYRAGDPLPDDVIAVV
jgi:hypothetical protein